MSSRALFKLRDIHKFALEGGPPQLGVVLVSIAFPQDKNQMLSFLPFGVKSKTLACEKNVKIHSQR